MYIYCIVSIFREIVNSMIPCDFPNHPYCFFFCVYLLQLLFHVSLWDVCMSGILLMRLKF